MSKIVIDDLLDETSFLSDANLRFQQIEDELNNNVLYRNNPVGEPNGMFNPLDMQKKDILNTGILHAESVLIRGVEIDGSPPIWGTLAGLISDQTDLDDRLVEAKNFGVVEVEIQKRTLLELLNGLKVDSDKALVWDKTNPNAPELSLHPTNTNQGEGGLVTLNNVGKIPQELIDASVTTIIGVFRGDDTCPKPDDEIGDTCTDPDTRNPSQFVNSPTFNNGDAYLLTYLAPDITGQINLVNPVDALGALTAQDVAQGDAIIYIEGRSGITQSGWWLWKDAVIINSASSIQYDTAVIPNNIITASPTKNVQQSLNDVDVNALSLISAALQTVTSDVAFTGDITHNGLVTLNGDLATGVLNTSDFTQGKILVPTPVDASDAVDKQTLDALQQLVTDLRTEVDALNAQMVGLAAATVQVAITQAVGVHDDRQADNAWGHVTMKAPAPDTLEITFEDPD